MAGVVINLTKNTWTLIASSDGSIFHKSGGGKVSYVEAISEPVGYDEGTPEMEITTVGDSFPVYSVDGGVYAYALNQDAVITYTPAGEV